MPLFVSDTRRALGEELARQSDPVNLATDFIGQDEYFMIDGTDPLRDPGCYRLRKWRGDYYFWKDGFYRPVSQDTVIANLTAWLQGDRTRVRATLGRTYRITRELIGNILLNLDPHVLIRESCEPNTWLDFETRPPTIALRNGLLRLGDLAEGGAPTLQPHTPNYFNFACLPFAYDPQADCPRWRAFLDEATDGRDDLIELLAQWVGYLFEPSLRQQKFLLCIGEGANGKGVFFEVVQDLLGRGNCSQVPLSRFGNPFALSATLGKLLNASSESTHVLDEQAESILKAFVAGDRLTFERKYRDPMHAVPTAKLMIATNALPRFADKTQGLWRRVLLVPFDRTIPEERQNRRLAEEIAANELPGIFNWALAGLADLHYRGHFQIPTVSRHALEEHRRDVDPARTFLLENFAASLEYEGLPAGEVYQAYVAWCTDHGYRPANAANFGRQVKRTFPASEKRRQRLGRRRVTIYTALAAIDGSEVAAAEPEPGPGVHSVHSKSFLLALETNGNERDPE